MLMDESELQFGELSYERRIVSFFDILGWRQHIEEAGDDPRRVARLASLPRMYSSYVLGALTEKLEGAHITAFSDNVIFSVPFDQTRLLWSIEGLATIQLAAAFAGFWIRGATTIGNLFHDDKIVFGPALNRAYELESELAKYPRTLIDTEILELRGLGGDFIATEDGVTFTDPFNVPFIERIRQNYIPNETVIERFNEIANASVPTTPIQIDGATLLYATLARIRAELTTTMPPCARRKLAWLFDRIAARLNWAERADHISPPQVG